MKIYKNYNINYYIMYLNKPFKSYENYTLIINKILYYIIMSEQIHYKRLYELSIIEKEKLLLEIKNYKLKNEELKKKKYRIKKKSNNSRKNT